MLFRLPQNPFVESLKLVLVKWGEGKKMKSLIGGPGTVSGLVLRVGQVLFASASIEVTDSAFRHYMLSTLCTSHTILQRCQLAVHIVCGIIGMRLFSKLLQVTVALSLATACSSAAVTVLYVTDWNVCSQHPALYCIRFQVSVALDFITWLLIAIGSLVTFWILGSVGSWKLEVRSSSLPQSNTVNRARIILLN
ncbi:hypothetical protein IFM89_035171 [Coptis chinensis]|uniref:CASP-like protein n=1 Tax=Coptis chinensis TaxID=261450 RepID=A0A835J041_9MAGN|nr:hypothetical protein IFM89_035171 [Coptis chinensis]